MAVHCLEVVGPQEYDLTAATLTDRAKHSYGAEAAADLAVHLPA
jgi:adenosine kinase